MKFSRFVKACRKYQFTFAMSTYGGLTLVLRPMNTFENITLSEDYLNYSKILKRGIKKMKHYREKH